MLIEKKLEKNDVAALRLVTGEEVVGTVKDLTASTIVLSKPLTLGIQRHQNPQTGQIHEGMAFGPYMLSLADDGSVKFELRDIMTSIKARKEISDAYIQSTTSLALPPEPSIIL